MTCVELSVTLDTNVKGLLLGYSENDPLNSEQLGKMRDIYLDKLFPYRNNATLCDSPRHYSRTIVLSEVLLGSPSVYRNSSGQWPGTWATYCPPADRKQE